MPREPPKRVYCNKRFHLKDVPKQYKSENLPHVEEKIKSGYRPGEVSCVVSKDPNMNRVVFMPCLSTTPTKKSYSVQHMMKEADINKIGSSNHLLLGFPKKYNYVTRNTEHHTQLMQEYLIENHCSEHLNNLHNDSLKNYSLDEEEPLVMTENKQKLVREAYEAVKESFEELLHDCPHYFDTFQSAQEKIFKHLEANANREAIEKISHPENFTMRKSSLSQASKEIDSSANYTPSLARAPPSLQDTPSSNKSSNHLFGPTSRRFRTSTPREYLPRSLEKSIEKALEIPEENSCPRPSYLTSNSFGDNVDPRQLTSTTTNLLRTNNRYK